MTADAAPALFWFRRDLRLDDNAGLAEALAAHASVVPVFVFDKTILDRLPRADRRVEFLWHAVAELKASLQREGSDLIVRHAHAETEIPRLADQYGARQVYANEDYEPAAHRRDLTVSDALDAAGVGLRLFKDTVVFAGSELLTRQGRPYTVFTPYKRAWLARLQPADYRARDSAGRKKALARLAPTPMPGLDQLGFEPTDLAGFGLVPTPEGALAMLRRFDEEGVGRYGKLRDVPAQAGTSLLSPYNRFGLVSVRHLVRHAQAAMGRIGDRAGAESWLGELIWRDFFFQVLYHHPHAAAGPFRRDYERLRWERNPEWLRAWCEGRTGYPLVDAAMTQLNTTGYMHNRLRMLTASFLSKDLLIDYREGEAYFARLLLDYDQAANNGGWQWSASTGCDAQPYFRIFSPARQSQRFDPEGVYIKRFLPVLGKAPGRCLHEPWKFEAELAAHGVRLGIEYPRPIVDHDERRRAALEAYRAARVD